jgi:hypothetical protein
LIALIANARRSTCDPPRKSLAAPLENRPPIRLGSLRTLLLVRGSGWRWTFKDQFCFKHIRELCGQAKPTTEML